MVAPLNFPAAPPAAERAELAVIPEIRPQPLSAWREFFPLLRALGRVAWLFLSNVFHVLVLDPAALSLSWSVWILTRPPRWLCLGSATVLSRLAAMTRAAEISPAVGHACTVLAHLLMDCAEVIDSLFTWLSPPSQNINRGPEG